MFARVGALFGNLLPTAKAAPDAPCAEASPATVGGRHQPGIAQTASDATQDAVQELNAKRGREAQQVSSSALVPSAGPDASTSATASADKTDLIELLSEDGVDDKI